MFQNLRDFLQHQASIHVNCLKQPVLRENA